MRGARRNPPFACDEDGGLRPPDRASRQSIGSTRPAKLLRGARKRNSMLAAATKQRDGQISKNLSSPQLKNIPLSSSGKSVV
jgi:hypothetical protein